MLTVFVAVCVYSGAIVDSKPFSAELKSEYPFTTTVMNYDLTFLFKNQSFKKVALILHSEVINFLDYPADENVKKMKLIELKIVFITITLTGIDIIELFIYGGKCL